jgi:hypothetical protein
MDRPVEHSDNLRPWWLGAIVAGALLSVCAAGMFYNWPDGTPASALDGERSDAADRTREPPQVAPVKPPVDPQILRRHAWDRVARHLAPADAASLAGIDHALEPIEAFFAEHRDGARPFARAVLGFRGKWKYVKSRRILGGDAEDHRAFLDEKFREHVFDPADLQHVSRSSIAAYLRETQGIENKLLVTVRTDIGELDADVGSMVLGLNNADQFAAAYQQILNGLVDDVAGGVRGDVGQFVGSLVAAEITEQLVARLGRAIATRLGVSAGVLGAGASGGAASAGVTIGLAIVIDMGIEWIMRLSGADAATKVTARVEDSLDGLRDFILDGDAAAVEAYHKIRARRDTFPTEAGRRKIDRALDDIEASGELGLRRMLFKLHQERSRLREQAIKKLILEGDAT